MPINGSAFGGKFGVQATTGVASPMSPKDFLDRPCQGLEARLFGSFQIAIEPTLTDLQDLA
jgi:hypothetical protein